MVICAKKNGKPRRTVDFQALNKHALRETHHTQSPFHQARQVPSGKCKTVFDAWNGYHSVPQHEDDRHKTTFITPWGRYRYLPAPQGYMASGDGDGAMMRWLRTSATRPNVWTTHSCGLIQLRRATSRRHNGWTFVAGTASSSTRINLSLPHPRWTLQASQSPSPTYGHAAVTWRLSETSHDHATSLTSGPGSDWSTKWPTASVWPNACNRSGNSYCMGYASSGLRNCSR